jgi:hypothetical protein
MPHRGGFEEFRSDLPKVIEEAPALERRISRGEDFQVGEIENIVSVLHNVTALRRTDFSAIR